MVKNIFKDRNIAMGYIEGLFPSRGSHAHFFDTHISNRGKEAYEFNIKCCIKVAPWMDGNWRAYDTRIEDELYDFVSFIKGEFEWIEEVLTAGRSGGWLVITTYDRIFEDWEDSDCIVNDEEIIERANQLYFIEQDIKKRIEWLESMSQEEAEEYWEFCKPEDWDEQVLIEKEKEERKREERVKREREVLDYIPGEKFYFLETTHRRFILNDRGDIISSYDKMRRNDNWDSYGRIPNGNPLIGWNRIEFFTQSGIAPRTVSLEEAFEGKSVRGLSFVVYNAPSGRMEYYGEIVESLYDISKERLVDYGIRKIA